METEKAASYLQELGNVTRLRIVRRLVRAGPEGQAVGEIQRHLGIPASTLSHHLSHLVNAGLVQQEREGRSLRCRLEFETINALIAFLTEKCCVDSEC